MRRHNRRSWEKDIGMKISKKDANIERFNELTNKSFDIMQNKAESELNPLKYQLSDEAKKRLKWMYIIQFECGNKIARAARKIGVSRQWLSKIHSRWNKLNRDPRCLEPGSRAPSNTDNRKRINAKTEEAIVAARDKYHWGKDKLITILGKEYNVQAGASTINRYLNKKGLINVKISNRIKIAHKNKIKQKKKCRPPKKIKDYKPGALIEKDMKFVLKMGRLTNFEKSKSKENFWYQHTMIDSFTRIRVLGLAEDGDSKTAATVQAECEKRFPFQIACTNTDNGSENEKDFDDYLEKNKIVHFYSRSGTPTDNPRVERSHLTDEIEFYQQGNVCKIFIEQKQKTIDWEYRYNYIRPHQALSNLTPMEFYALWKKNPEATYKIAEKWNIYLKKQSERLANSRKMRNRDKIAKLMEQIDIKLANSYK